MLVHRALSRAVPRTSSRIASYSTKTVLRPALHSSLRPSPIISRLQPLKICSFSTTHARFDDVGQELSAKLDSEIQLETEDKDKEADSDSNVKAFLDQNPDWTLEDNDGEQEVVLRRKYDDEDITVAFSIVDFNTPSMMDQDEPDEAFADEEDIEESSQSGGANTKGSINQGRTSAGNMKVAPEDSVAPADREELKSDEDDYDNQQAFPANVNVLIQRPSKGALRINLVTDNGRFTIHGVTHLPAAEGKPTELLRHTPDNLYTGPPFQQLDEEVQGLLEQYLDVRGVNTALALFIPDYIDVKEQKEYLGWLGRVKSFVG